MKNTYWYMVYRIAGEKTISIEERKLNSIEEATERFMKSFQNFSGNKAEFVEESEFTNSKGNGKEIIVKYYFTHCGIQWLVKVKSYIYED